MALTIGPLRADLGQKTCGSLPADLGTTTVDVPLILVNGSRPGPRVVITGGVHGGEFSACCRSVWPVHRKVAAEPR